jgi:KDO2-lipid IV(A) lauroyltransferase|tara:strand:+ start:129 stop:989 length:861 start_codon:yes stop_codon:yes gene_type:complete
MKTLKYFFQFIIIITFFLIFKLIGKKFAVIISDCLIKFLGPLFRSKKIIEKNLLRAIPNLTRKEIETITSNMWGNYGKILAEYVFIKNFRKSNLKDKIHIDGQEILENIKRDKEPVIFISGHFNNFELMAMHIERSGIELAAIYRPLNNKFLNFVMEKIRKKYICQNQIKKGISGMKQLLLFFKKKTSIALMIDQRVSEGIKSDFFKQKAYTTTIPAQFVKKFNCKVVPIYIERKKDLSFQLTIYNPIKYTNEDSIDSITLQLNSILEKMILKNPDQWIWSHNRWK